MIVDKENFINDEENSILLDFLNKESSKIEITEDPFYVWIDLKKTEHINHPFILRVINRLQFFSHQNTGKNYKVSYLGFAYQTRGFDYHADSVWPENADDRSLGTPENGKNTYKNYDGNWVPNYVPDRKFTTVLYLNDDIIGGETHFPTLNVTINPKKNKIVGFECDEHHIHGVMPTEHGIRKTFIAWFE